MLAAVLVASAFTSGSPDRIGASRAGTWDMMLSEIASMPGVVNGGGANGIVSADVINSFPRLLSSVGSTLRGSGGML